MGITIHEHNQGNAMSFQCLIRLGFLFRAAEEAGTLGLWHYDYDGEMTEALFFQFIGQHCFGGGRLITAWLDDRKPIAGMLCEDVPGGGKSKRVHFINCLRPHGDEDWAALFAGCRAMLDYAFERLGVVSLMGFIPVINQGALRFVRRCGFESRRIIKDCCYIDRLKRNVDGHLVVIERG